MIIIITKLYNIVNYETKICEMCEMFSCLQKNNIFITIGISEFNLGDILKI